MNIGLETNEIYNKDCVEGMKELYDNSIDLTVTSPPYDNLRDYEHQNIDELWNFDVFKTVADELYRVTKDGGVVVWVVGDAVINGSESGSSFRQALYFKEIGFNIHDTMIYEKNGPSFPANDKSTRYSQVFEYMFIFSKGKPKTANLLKDRKNKWGGTSTFGKHSSRGKDGEKKQSNKFTVQEYGYRFNIWKYNTGRGYSTKDEVAYDHPAIFPEQLAYDHILTWSNENDIVLDPFMGSGTTAKMCIKADRQYIGFERNENFYNLSKKRLEKYTLEKLNEW